MKVSINTIVFSVLLNFIQFNLSFSQCIDPPTLVTTVSDYRSSPPFCMPSPSQPAQAGSSFQGCTNGVITDIEVRFHPSNTATNATLILRDIAMAGAIGTVGGVTNEYNQPVTFPSGASTTPFALSTPYPVAVGSTYAWFLQGPDIVLDLALTTNPYSQGGVMDNCTAPFPSATSDLAFRVFVTPTSTGPVSVPTLNQWSLIVLGLILLIVGIVALNKSSLRSKDLSIS